MKLLFFSYSDNQGGAAKAAFSLFKSIKKNNFIKCDFVCIHKLFRESIKLVNKFNFFYLCILRLIEKFIIIFFKTKFHQSLNIFNTFNLSKINKIDYDIINLHWINRCSLSLNEILKIKKKILISLHDMWFLNGTSHYFYKNKNSLLDKYIFFLKKKIYCKNNIFFIAHTKWMYKNALKLIPKKKVFFCKYYPIDTELFRPRNKEMLKKKFNIQTKNKIVLFSAQNISDPRKGQFYFYKLVKYFSLKNNYHFIIVGNGRLEIKYQQFDNISHFSFLERKEMAEIYSLSDIYVCTSVIDNLPLTVLEAMSSGLVIIAFDSGGVKEVIGNCGYVIYKHKYENIIKILSKLNNKLIINKSKKTRDFALKNFSYSKFKNTYTAIVNKINSKYFNYLN